MKKKNSYIGSKAAMILGVLTIASGSTPAYASNTSSGTAMLLGGLLYMARKKQIGIQSTKWAIIEITSGVLLILFTLLGIFSGAWYLHPIGFVVVPVWTLIAYIMVSRKKHTPALAS